MNMKKKYIIKKISRNQTGTGIAIGDSKNAAQFCSLQRNGVLEFQQSSQKVKIELV